MTNPGRCEPIVFPAQKEAMLTQEDPRNEQMHIVLVWVLNIANGQTVELLRFSTAIEIDWEKNRPSHTKPNEANQYNHLQEPKEEIGVQGLLLEQFMIFQPPKRRYPVEPSILVKRRRSFHLIKSIENCPRSIKVALGPSQKKKG